MAERVRVGVVGTSGWANLGYLPGLQAHSGAELTAICGRDRHRAEERARQYGIPRVFTDYREMIATADLQALIVVAPDDLHHPIVMEALGARLHVLCEKPLAHTTTQAREMYEAPEAAGVRHLIPFSYRWFPPAIHLRDFLVGGYVGRPYHCNIRYFTGYAHDTSYRWRFDRRRTHGALSDLGAHMIDLARWYLGDIVGVSARLGVAVARAGVDDQPLEPSNDSAALMVEFRDGAAGVIHVSAVAHTGTGFADMQRQEVEIHGDAGTLTLALTLGGGEVRGARRDESRLRPLPVPAALWGEVDPAQPIDVFTKHAAGARAFIDAILAAQPATPSFYDGLKAQEVVEAALLSDREGRWVTLER
ncbi:MAG TPA: Gfo/Idh/MocA family oxidoreductase [Thermomicrobiales bacterium]